MREERKTEINKNPTHHHTLINTLVSDITDHSSSISGLTQLLGLGQVHHGKTALMMMWFKSQETVCLNTMCVFVSPLCPCSRSMTYKFINDKIKKRWICESTLKNE